MLVEKISIEFYLNKQISIDDVVKALNRRFRAKSKHKFKKSSVGYRYKKGTECIYLPYEQITNNRTEEFISKCNWFEYWVEPYLYRKYGQKIKIVAKY